ncbi:DUF221-domain-containing protein [Sodiomyces alkalinus F11]|uniref:DUF221-domain-containing protein n=1 Tax=Sodiomyces alkalinus (strain CBS 110278 / VKM F-3762 / F11) TaxID=1314773 RepID=A0A3N2Q537_SODAK|nr:DUF221-domain-containing protein [Sodiomyces alkalinus F11]ROT41768.1 DUF221-domain-containing protein [Sodiomyces alkalinus F11]
MDGRLGAIFGRRQQHDAGQILLELLEDPFSSQIVSTSFWAALGTSLGFTAGIALAFSFLRPYNQAVYAPKLKHADEKHAPPPLGRRPWSWLPPLWSTSEYDLIQNAGMDAAIFLRFIGMLRNMFLVLSLFVLAVLIPVNLTQADEIGSGRTWIARLTPALVWGEGQWSQVAIAYIMNTTVMFFLWWNYRKVLHLRRRYFESEEYQNSLHSRTLMMYDIPKERCSDEGIARTIDEIVPNSSFSRTAIARNVKDLPKLIAEHDRIVRKLESVLAKYMKNPDQLPPERPTCRPSKKDPAYETYPSDQKVDAIEYLTNRIKQLEVEIKEVRKTVDKRSTMPYGFASYADITEAHNIAYACRKKHPVGATIRLAPRPNDIIWNNLPLDASTRSRRRVINNLWILLLTVVWIVPNAMIAIFLVNLSNLGRVFPDFQPVLEGNPTLWGFVQGILSPAITSLVFLVLPTIFRRLSMKAGDQTKTGRERHVLGKLYAFFVFNNLVVFSLFGSAWKFVAGVINRTNKGEDAWRAIQEEDIGSTLFIALCDISPFFVSWLLQRQLGAAIDLAQLWTLIYSFFVRKFSSPTPRELIELTAPPTFNYASYYNYFLFYTTIALCFAGIQPLAIPAVALYFGIDVWLKKYLLMYIFVTKNESGGMFWRALFNRVVFATVLGDLVFFLTTWVRGEGFIRRHALTVAPLPFVMILFKFLCARQFDDKAKYYSTRNVAKHPEESMKDHRLRSERLASRFGHPALYKPLITPMVHQKAQATLHIVYKGRVSDGRDAGGAADDIMSVSGYSDMYALDAMAAGKPGKQAQAAGVPGFEFVSEAQMDFEYYKNRPEFADEYGGTQGDQLGGRNLDLMRPGSPGSAAEGGDSDYSRPGTPTTTVAGGMTGRRVLQKASTDNFTAYRPPHSTSGYNSGRSSPGIVSPAPFVPAQLGTPMGTDRTRSPLYGLNNSSETALVQDAARMGTVTPAYGMAAAGRREPSVDSYRRQNTTTPGPSTGALGGGPQGYSGLPQVEFGESPSELQDPTQVDYFRHGRPRRQGSGW